MPGRVSTTSRGTALAILAPWCSGPLRQWKRRVTEARCVQCLMPLAEPMAELCLRCQHISEAERHERLAEVHRREASRVEEAPVLVREAPRSKG